MSIQYIRSNIFFFIISYLLLFIFVFFTSYKFFVNDFMLLEKIQNESNLKTFLNNVNNDLENLKNITNDYAKWDDTYIFAKDKNEKYIYENFREGTLTLQNLKIQGIIYLNLKEEVLFSTYSNEELKAKKNSFEKYIIDKFKEKDDLSTIINFDSEFLYLAKSEILKSDDSGNVRGFVVTIKNLDNDFLEKNHSIFKEINITNKKSEKFDTEFHLTTLKNVKITVDTDSKFIINNINFFDYNNEYIISINSFNFRDIVEHGKETIYIFNLIFSIILFLIFFYMYKNQYLVETQNEMLNKEVSKRTRQLDKAFRKLKNKNQELYNLANIDYLTKIKNRRSFFIQSEQALEKAIKNNHNLCILMIDIDFFKSINDTYGHSVGDKVLMEFCMIVDSSIEEDAIFGRIGGEEFCITFYDKTIIDVNKIAEDIRNKCETNEIIINNQKIKFTVSMGLSCRENMNNIDKILQKSDELLYEAKNSGRNRLIRTNR